MTWRARLAARQAEDAKALWRHQRAVARVRVIDDVLADYVKEYCGRPFRRRDVAPMESAVELPGVTWTIDGDVIVEMLTGEHGPSRVVVHDVALLSTLKRRLRTRHLTVEHISASWR